LEEAVHHKLSQRSIVHLVGLALALLGACHDAPEGEPTLGRLIEFTPPPEQDMASLGYAPNADGTYTIIDVGGMELIIDPKRRSPLSTLHLCNSWLVACYAPPERALDDCYRSAPRCLSDDAWKTREQCCPAACYTQYVARRHQGHESLAAWMEVTKDASCFSDVTTYLATGALP
jgi:hypothetical protein